MLCRVFSKKTLYDMPLRFAIFLTTALWSFTPSAAWADETLQTLMDKARHGDEQAQVDLAKRYEEGEGVDQSDSKAAEWFQVAANQGQAEAQYYLGWMYANGYGLPQDRVQAMIWFERSAAQGNKDAADLKMATMREMSAEELADLRGRQAAPENGATTPEIVISPELADFNFLEVRRGYNRDGATKQWMDALLLLARRGFPGAQNLLGFHLLKTASGDKAEAMRQEAMRWFLASARQAYAAGAYNLGVCFMEGRGIKRDMFSAVRWFEIAKASLPTDRPADYNQAASLFREAAEYHHMDVYDAARQGYLSASTQLGELIEMRLTEAKARRNLKD